MGISCLPHGKEWRVRGKPAVGGATLRIWIFARMPEYVMIVASEAGTDTLCPLVPDKSTGERLYRTKGTAPPASHRERDQAARSASGAQGGP